MIANPSPISVDRLRAPGTVLLDESGSHGGSAGSLLFEEPESVLSAEHPDDVETLLDELDDRVSAGRHAAGYVSYEASHGWMNLAGARVDGDGPLVWFGIYDAPTRVEGAALDTAFATLPGRASRVGYARGVDPPGPALTIPDDDYLAAVRSVRALIREGDVYQVNVTGRFEMLFDGDPLALYGRLRKRQPVGYAAWIETGNRQILSASPELFFRRTGRRIETRPMKGTVSRGRTDLEDEALVDWLRTDPKSRAENLMIVDLLRNDLSVVCETGSVEVPALFVVESYPTLHQMTSTVTGRLRADASTGDLFRALFPCGSVTGAPKRRAMRRILELESAPRGLYCGSIGYLAPGGKAVFNVAIRTAVVSGGRLRLGSGSGIVWDSEEHEELEEARLKTRFLTGTNPDDRDRGFQLIETMLAEDGRIEMMDAHLDRVLASARVFGWFPGRTSIERRLTDVLAGLAPGRHRLRMLVGPGGVESIETRMIGEDAGEETVKIGIARTEVHSDNPFLRHKTTMRDAYDRGAREAIERGLDDVLLVNERGEITETTVCNVFLRHGSEWSTPPVSSGLLRGIARSVFKDVTGAVERILRPGDVREADEIVLTNAVRGARRAKLVEL